MTSVAVLALLLTGTGDGTCAAIESAAVFKRSELLPGSEAKRIENEIGHKFGYRIPSLWVTKKGTILAFADRRKIPLDSEPIAKLHDNGVPTDGVLKRSLDRGKTWEPEQIIFKGADCNFHGGMVIQDRENGRIFKFARRGPLADSPDVTFFKVKDPLSKFRPPVPYLEIEARGYGDFYVFSDDDGKTWSKPKQAKLPYPTESIKCCVANGVHGVQLQNGRMVIATMTSRPSGVAGKFIERSQLFFSDDGGDSWQAGPIWGDKDSSPLEVCLAILGDGRIFTSQRPKSREKNSSRNGYIFDRTSFLDSSVQRYGHSLYAAVCHAGITEYPIAGTTMNPIFLTAPQATTTPNQEELRRKKLVLMRTDDAGKNWHHCAVLDSTFSAYSDLQVAPDGSLYCLYEGGRNNRTIRFLRVPKQQMETFLSTRQNN